MEANLNKWNVLCAAGLATASACAQADVLLKVEGAAAGLSGRPLYVDGVPVGLVGDTISVSQVRHEIAVDLPQGIRDINEIHTVDGQLQARSVANQACVGSAAWSIVDPPAPEVSQENGVAVLHLHGLTPRYEGPCEYELPNLQCLDKYTDVTVNSTPEVNAEIWFNGAPIGQHTSASIKVHYCVGMEPTISVLVRKPGYVNCTRSVRPTTTETASSSEYAVVCPMQTVQQAAIDAGTAKITVAGLASQRETRPDLTR